MIKYNNRYYRILASNEFKTLFVDELSPVRDSISYSEFSRIYTSDLFGCIASDQVEIISLV